MKQATERDLQFERWLRMRENGEIVWKTKIGEFIPIKDMTDQHLENTIRMIERNDDWENNLDEAFGSCSEDDFYDK